jgi:plasmid stabilization system protein ParE
MTPLVFLPDALDDIDSAYATYEQRALGLGDRFLEALRVVLLRVAENPALYSVVFRDVRAAPMRRFPHVVYFRANAGRVLIIAVQHGRRGSLAWRSRA